MDKVTDIAGDFVQRYLGENDFRYVKPDVPVFESFLPDVQQIVEYLIAGVVGAIGKDIYELIKRELFKHHRDAPEGRLGILLKRGDFEGIKTSINVPEDAGIFFMRGEDMNTTIVQAGKLRPLFRISKGSILLLQDLIIEYEGPPVGLIEEERAPSFFSSNVVFRQRRT